MSMEISYSFIAAIFVVIYLLISAAMKFNNNLSINVKPTFTHPRCSISRYFKALLSTPKLVLIVLGLMLLVLLTKYWDQNFSPIKKSPHYFRAVNTFWGHLHDGEKIREIVCSRFSKDCFAILDADQSQNMVIRYLFSEKLGIGGYFTRSLVKKENGKEIVLKGDVVSGYVRGMLLACFLTGGLGKKDRNESVLIVGLGGGAMNNFFSTMENQPYVTIVDIDPTIYYIARRWYDSKPTSYQEYFVDDAITFVQNRSSLLSSTNNTNLLYDVILIDCSATEPTYDLVAPIVEFMDPKVLEDVKAILKPDGTVVVNVVSFNLELGPKILKKPHDIYKNLFKTCFFLKASNNFVMVCTDKDVNGNSYQGFEALVQSLPKSIQDSLAKDILHQPYFETNVVNSF